jgi:mannosylglucosylglycerate synthase
MNTRMALPSVAILHYTLPPTVGGVEAVIKAHAQVFLGAGYPVTAVAGRGESNALPSGVDLSLVPEMDSQHPSIAEISLELAQGHIPPTFPGMVDRLVAALLPLLRRCDVVIAHNLFTKHFNLPLTVALFRLLETGGIQHCIAWCHDFSWTSPSSRAHLHPGHPWDLLRTPIPGVTYVVVSQSRQQALADLLALPPEQIHVIYNGIDPTSLLGLSPEGAALVRRLGLLECDLVLLMPVRVTRAKNIEYALEVVAALKARGCRLKLVLTGPPDPHSADSLAYFRDLQRLRQHLQVEEEMRFVFESGPDPEQPFIIDMRVVGDLYRVSDLMFMPSHREGFGMPVLEAGMAGIPAVCTDVPAAIEIGLPDAIVFDEAEDPGQLADRILNWSRETRVHRLRRRVRQRYTWEAILARDIEPLLRDRLNPR